MRTKSSTAPRLTVSSRPALKFLEFFAGGGMVRAGLAEGWRCLLANDFDFKKAASYRLNWPCENELRVGDVRQISASSVPTADMAWASFPCQDLSLAGGGAGLKGERSGTFYPFWEIMNGLVAERRAPTVIALENVVGTLTSHSGKDFAAVCASFARSGYRFGAVVIDAALFVPQSRPRLFVVGVRADALSADALAPLVSPEPVGPFHSASLRRAHSLLRGDAKQAWVWWNLPVPPRRRTTFADVLQDSPEGVEWHTPSETAALLEMMSPVNLAKVEAAKRAGRVMVGGIYKRTRREPSGVKQQRAEVRFDDIAGCLRTPGGGSSRQVILVVDGRRVRSRLISARETARLMGLPDAYKLPARYNEAYHLTGDGVVVPVVRHLAEHLLEPLVGTAAARP